MSQRLAIPFRIVGGAVGRGSEVGDQLFPAVVHRNREFVGMTVAAAVRAVFQHHGRFGAAQQGESGVFETETLLPQRFRGGSDPLRIQQRITAAPLHITIALGQHVAEKRVAEAGVRRFEQPGLRDERLAVPAVVVGRESQVGIDAPHRRREHIVQLFVIQVDVAASHGVGRHHDSPERIEMVDRRTFVPPSVRIDVSGHQRPVAALGIVERHADQPVVAQSDGQGRQAAVVPHLPVAAVAAAQQQVGALPEKIAFDFPLLRPGQRTAYGDVGPGGGTEPHRFVEALSEHLAAVRLGGFAPGIVHHVIGIHVRVIEQHVTDILRIAGFARGQIEIHAVRQESQVVGMHEIHPAPVISVHAPVLPVTGGAIVRRGMVPAEGEGDVMDRTDVEMAVAGLHRGNLHVVRQPLVDAPAHGRHDPPAPIGLRRLADMRHIVSGEEVELLRGFGTGLVLPVSGKPEEQQPGGREISQLQTHLRHFLFIPFQSAEK